jgi:Iap family predicted aminopeptidase
MFFLYVLKEEKKCPVTEVFEEYIKPIETSRFTQDYGEDYRKVLKKIKKHTKYEKIYNKALKKMKLLKGGKFNKSDSCLPITISTPFNEESKRKSRTPVI